MGALMHIPFLKKKYRHLSKDAQRIAEVAERGYRDAALMVTQAATFMDAFAVDCDRAHAALREVQSTAEGRAGLAAMRTAFSGTKVLLGTHITLLDHALEVLGPEPPPDHLRVVR